MVLTCLTDFYIHRICTCPCGHLHICTQVTAFPRSKIPKRKPKRSSNNGSSWPSQLQTPPTPIHQGRGEEVTANRVGRHVHAWLCVGVLRIYVHVKILVIKTSEGARDLAEGPRCFLSCSGSGSKWNVCRWETLSHHQGNCGRQDPMSHSGKRHQSFLRKRRADPLDSNF